jgi:hypothetical protein
MYVFAGVDDDGAGELFVEGAFAWVVQLHEDAVVGPAQAFERRRAAVPIGVEEGLGGGAFGFLFVFADDGAEVGEEGGVLLFGEERGGFGKWWHFGPAGRD